MALTRGATGLWEVCVGLEVHVQLATASKLFSGAAAGAAGTPPNSAVALFDAAHPGTLPRLNAGAVAAALRAALALRATVPRASRFVRKHYAYADLPHGFQVTQLDEPFARGGFVAYAAGGAPRGARGAPRVARVERLQIETDAGKLVHGSDGGGDDGGGASRVDLNRAGAPLLEIVFAPDVRAPADAAALVSAVADVVRAAGAGDAAMELGGLRADVNVSVRRARGGDGGDGGGGGGSGNGGGGGDTSRAIDEAHDALADALDGEYVYGDLGAAASRAAGGAHAAVGDSAGGRGWAWVFASPAAAARALAHGAGIGSAHAAPVTLSGVASALTPLALGFGARVEYKNLNSLRAVASAVAAEAARQVAVLEAGGAVEPSTRSFDAARGVGARLRGKGDAPDYRFLREPDVPPLLVPRRVFDAALASAPLPRTARRRRLIDAHGLDAAAADALSAGAAAGDAYAEVLAAALASLAEEGAGGAGGAEAPAFVAAAAALAAGEPLPPRGRDTARAVAAWLTGDAIGALREAGADARAALAPAAGLAPRLGRLVALVVAGRVSGRAAKDILRELIERGGEARDIAAARSLFLLRDRAAIDALARAAVAAPEMRDAALKWRGGSERALGGFVARVVAASGGRACPSMASEALVALLGPCARRADHVGRKERARRASAAAQEGAAQDT